MSQEISKRYAQRGVSAAKEEVQSQTLSISEQVLTDYAQAARLVEQTTIVSSARKEATRILADANADSKKDREEIEAYIDSRLATLEVILNKTLDVISKGRDQLGGADTKHALSNLDK